MVKFGPSGNGEMFYAEGYDSTVQAPKWLKEKGLDLLEYSFGRGIRLKMETAKAIGEEAKKHGIEISVHAPYYINFANPDDEMIEKSINYVITSLKYLRAFGGTRCVFHPGSQGKATREEAMDRIMQSLEKLVERVYLEGLDDMYICPETMGKSMQMGTYEEVAKMCKIDKILLPTVDFGHVNSFTGGSLKTDADFEKIIDCFEKELGEFKSKNFHVHFSKIEYGAKGEIRHLTLEDEVYGPEFEPLARVIKKRGLTPTIISESKVVMARDAMRLKEILKNTK